MAVGLVGIDEVVDPVAEGHVVDMGTEGEGGGVAVEVHQGPLGWSSVGVLSHYVVDGLLELGWVHAGDLDDARGGGKGFFDKAFFIVFPATGHEQEQGGNGREDEQVSGVHGDVAKE